MGAPFTLTNLHEFVQESFGIQEIPATIRKQINNYMINDNMTAKEIARCICYYQEVKGGKLDTLYGIWFVPNVREAAAAHFKKLELEQQNQTAEAQKVVQYQDNNIIFNIKSLKHHKRKPKQLDVMDINIGENND